ncbi:hypothetical protein [Nitrosovibrio sp. Nv6]|uniref:hypothetical protein n=1 Tax=Nitrosovibrio sp. Nv6 TaxID=1855340 RepID=UPI0008CAC23E|nr:hypothetical protein [Nitrosovibrio sp. Nv6]SEO78878.1 hypothetical protein SAMN05216316_1104 [Nitrosovibrio sp. Nv6]
MNVYAEAVKAGGDYWNVYMPDVMANSHARSNVTAAGFDDYRMFMAEKYKDIRRAFQITT